ncbi:hypothetical protein ACFFSY_12200 [Paenibacillus aurantiacus]|uniref:DUF3992 domain-containing protein n=1 Tax=Paenibacillus aurantiacus TaxID=1936118 RepID=A0ABV5KRF2_9BACL
MAAILLPQQVFNVPAGVSKSYFENLTGPVNASVTVQNNSTFSVTLILTHANGPTINYVIPAAQSLTVVVPGLLLAGLFSNGGGATFGYIQVAVATL